MEGGICGQIAAGCLSWLLGDRQVAVLVGHEPAVVGVAGKDLVQRRCTSQRGGSVRAGVQDIQRAEPEDQGLDIADHVFDVIFTEGKQPQQPPRAISSFPMTGLPSGCPRAALTAVMFRSPTCWVMK